MRTAGSYFPDKTNERPGTRAQARYVRLSPTKARVVLDLVRGKTVQQAGEILQFTERDAADVVGKVLASAVANAITNDGETAEELYVSACYADEGPTLKRWRPRARGRATRIRKRTCHVTVIVSPMSPEQLAVVRARRATRAAGRPGRVPRTAAEARRRRVAGSRGGAEAAPQPGDVSGETAELVPAPEPDGPEVTPAEGSPEGPMVEGGEDVTAEDVIADATAEDSAGAEGDDIATASSGADEADTTGAAEAEAGDTTDDGDEATAAGGGADDRPRSGQPDDEEGA